MMNTIHTSDLLIEIGCEELPAKSLYAMEQAFGTAVSQALQTLGISFATLQAFSTPRRLALCFKAILTQQASTTQSKQGPTKALALDAQGQWTPAALGFAASCGIEAKDLLFEATDKGERLTHTQTVAGKSLNALLPPLLTKVLMDLPVGKRMRLAQVGASFSRPIQWIVLLLDDQPIQTDIFGIRTDRFSRGHRFHHPEPLAIPNVDAYASTLKQTKVMVSFTERLDFIQKALQRLAAEQKASAVIPEALLNEVTGLVEWPSVLLGSFKKDFLAIPQEVLTSSMNTHQKCFALMDMQQQLLPLFLTVSNIDSKNPQTVIKGNECVIDARLVDAAFYYETDKKHSLYHYREDLKQVRFQEGLGTLWDKTERLAKLALMLAQTMKSSTAGISTGTKQGDPIDPACCEKASKLCKSDLLSQMVGEFPELQGVMGQYYALAEGVAPPIAQAIEEHYYPRFAKDDLPISLYGTVLAIADRIDTLVGLFGMGKIPTGSKDPFSLRRQALGLIRLLIEKKIPIDLCDVFQYAASLYPANTLKNNINNLLTFCMERLKPYLQEQGIAPSIFEAIANSDSTKNGLSITKPLDFYERALALNYFLSQSEAPILIASNKRVKNILKDIPVNSDKNTEIDLKNNLKESSEKNLLESLGTQEKALIPFLEANPKQYTQALQSLSDLAAPLDQFFESVMVMCEDPVLRSSRLALLQRLRLLFLQIADFSFL
ncbi:MAG: glycine--tRNA ligase subunit beta [Gammaproteobacteria bacterium]|nr:glycine--tRNA ligase subunit beta [Gammaproteobacteria bacterium]MBP9729435.1 glycine--tRNA ligase subunit beta [Gammaproteobacteria bacterium]